mmetsp:Transcript_12128/g.23432  ORF Transcript_12128/g.23432 Transcript_12128/m.23432 type:complete len:369 (+) Transcript_12128:396-1502(+)
MRAGRQGPSDSSGLFICLVLGLIPTRLLLPPLLVFFLSRAAGSFGRVLLCFSLIFLFCILHLLLCSILAVLLPFVLHIFLFRGFCILLFRVFLSHRFAVFLNFFPRGFLFSVLHVFLLCILILFLPCVVTVLAGTLPVSVKLTNALSGTLRTVVLSLSVQTKLFGSTRPASRTPDRMTANPLSVPAVLAIFAFPPPPVVSTKLVACNDLQHLVGVGGSRRRRLQGRRHRLLGGQSTLNRNRPAGGTRRHSPSVGSAAANGCRRELVGDLNLRHFGRICEGVERTGACHRSSRVLGCQRGLLGRKGNKQLWRSFPLQRRRVLTRRICFRRAGRHWGNVMDRCRLTHSATVSIKERKNSPELSSEMQIAR